MSKISVIIPVYNVENYLEQCLDSVLNQTFADIEIICINDGSTDNSLKILQNYAQKESRIKIINKENSGYGASMNIGIGTAQGEYIGIVESDDFIEPDMFEKLYNTAVSNNLDLVRCQYYQYNSLKNINNTVFIDWIEKNKIYKPLDFQPIFYQPPAIWSNLVKKELLEKYNIKFLETPGASYQDTSFAFKLYCASERFMMIEDCLLHYRIDNENSSVNSKQKAFYVNTEYGEISHFAVKNGFYKRVRKLIPKIKYGCYMWNYERLNKRFKLPFLLRWSFENLRDFCLGNIDKKLYTSSQYFKIFIITFFPYLYLLRRKK